MLRSRAALCVSFCLFASCYSEDRPLNDFVTGGTAGSGGTSLPQAGESNADAGEAADGGGAVSGTGGSQATGAGGTAGSGEPGSGGSKVGTAGASGDGGTSGDGNGNAGEGAGANIPAGALCNSSDGDGCGSGQFCIDAANDNCAPDSEDTCPGFCAEAAPRATLTTTCGDGVCPENYSCVPDPVDAGRMFCTGTRACDASVPCPGGFVCGTDGSCVPDRVTCSGPILCPAIAAACEPGYTHAIVDDCFGPCVPVESCGCESDSDCIDGAASCDRVTGRCVFPKAPEPRCALPFESGDCLAAMSVFAFVDGRCQPQIYGGCDGNDNRFWSMEECRRRCEGEPIPSDCAEGRVLATICLACGPLDGCAERQTLCAQKCEEQTDCPPRSHCEEGVCQVGPCF